MIPYEKLVYTNEKGGSVEFSTNSVYHCNVSKDVGGIAGVTSVLYSTNSMGQHGDTYVGQRIEARDIDISGHINIKSKDEAYSLRRNLVKTLNPELGGTLTYEYRNFKRMINCRIHGKPEFKRGNVLVGFDVQLECLSPFWREETEAREEVAKWQSDWIFPCIIERDDPESMIFGHRSESVIVNCYNRGDIATGMRVRFSALGTIVNPEIMNIDTGEYIRVNVTMQAKDIVEVNTNYGSKGAKLIRDGVEENCFRYIDVDSTFLQLDIGDNNFRYDAAEGVNNLEATVFYNNEYLGV